MLVDGEGLEFDWLGGGVAGRKGGIGQGLAV